MKKNEYNFTHIRTKKLYFITIFASILYFGFAAFIVDKIGDLFFSNLTEIGRLLFLNIICSLVLTAFLLFTLKDFYVESFIDLKNNRGWNNIKWFLKGTVYYLLLPFLLVFPPILIALINGWPIELQSKNQELINSLLTSESAVVIILSCILAPFVEESLFRGLIYQSLRKIMNASSAILLASLLFGLVHMKGEILHFDIGTLIWLMRYIASGIALGILYEKRRNILVNIFFHMAVNIITTMEIIL